jgi:leader peptidase (prepilin peptidase)/N-methyltransferase
MAGVVHWRAMVPVFLAHLRGRPLHAATRLPFGAFLCPALWLVFYAGVRGS